MSSMISWLLAELDLLLEGRPLGLVALYARFSGVVLDKRGFLPQLSHLGEFFQAFSNS